MSSSNKANIWILVAFLILVLIGILFSSCWNNKEEDIVCASEKPEEYKARHGVASRMNQL